MIRVKKINIFPTILLFLIGFVVAHTGIDDYAHHSMMGGVYGYGFMWVFGWLFMILIVVALVLLILWLIKQVVKK